MISIVKACFSCNFVAKTYLEKALEGRVAHRLNDKWQSKEVDVFLLRGQDGTLMVEKIPDIFHALDQADPLLGHHATIELNMEPEIELYKRFRAIRMRKQLGAVPNLKGGTHSVVIELT